MDKGRYQRSVGELIYLSLTRPDIVFVISVVSQFMHSLTQIFKCHESNSYISKKNTWARAHVLKE
uniref:Retrovirus-related Pol polyprotein from transposon TNT 1-94 n=1 Tax=Rhizophora mucronata TaxID=61149 RepID=A0A2P2PLW2_RHIMU